MLLNHGIINRTMVTIARCHVPCQLTAGLLGAQNCLPTLETQALSGGLDSSEGKRHAWCAGAGLSSHRCTYILLEMSS